MCLCTMNKARHYSYRTDRQTIIPEDDENAENKEETDQKEKSEKEEEEKPKETVSIYITLYTSLYSIRNP